MVYCYTVYAIDYQNMILGSDDFMFLMNYHIHLIFAVDLVSHISRVDGYLPIKNREMCGTCEKELHIGKIKTANIS